MSPARLADAIEKNKRFFGLPIVSFPKAGGQGKRLPNNAFLRN
jgi:hypothetical protein